jgi:hypothetical protein
MGVENLRLVVLKPGEPNQLVRLEVNRIGMVKVFQRILSKTKISLRAKAKAANTRGLFFKGHQIFHTTLHDKNGVVDG